MRYPRGSILNHQSYRSDTTRIGIAFVIICNLFLAIGYAIGYHSGALDHNTKAYLNVKTAAQDDAWRTLRGLK